MVVGEEREEKRGGWKLAIGESYKPFSEEAEPEKEGSRGAMSPYSY